MIWLVGTGPMARDYAQVLRHLNIDFLVIGRDSAKTAAFAADFNQSGRGGGVEVAVSEVKAGKLPAPSHAIVATQIDALATIGRQLLAVCGTILLEKPGALEAQDMRQLAEHPDITTGKRHIYVAYNRRFLPSVSELRRRIKTEGPVLSVIAEFDEPIPRIEALSTDAAIKARWGYANASHVLDLVWHLCGKSVQHTPASSMGRGDPLAWHASGSVFVGSGATSSGTQYVYHGNYASVGRWRLAFSLPKRRYLLMPLETLELVEGNSVMPTKIDLAQSASDTLKPGLREQVEALLNGNRDGLLPTAADQTWHLSHLASIFGYPA